MRRVSRRRVLAGAATIPFAQWLATTQAQAGPALVRRNLATSAAATDIQKYADGVKAMMALPESDPRGWMFWWYVHSVRSDRGKASEISRVYGSGSSAAKTLANASWETCHSHHGEPEDFFLPWHRLYVLWLEATIRKLVGDPSFALPYWHYTDPAHRDLPAKFRMSGDPTWGPLYRSARNPGINTGTAIDSGLSPTPINTDSLSETTYSASGSSSGFCGDIDGNLHGSVHVQVGNSVGMGHVPWAANDPVFWMHHCNIDRMWASWNANGGCNPTSNSWLSATFTFPDADGNSVVGKVSDVKAIGPLNYTYDAFEPGPKVGTCNRILIPWWELRPIYLIPEPWLIDPGGPVERGLNLQAVEAAAGIAARPELRAVQTARARLIISGLKAEVQPGVLFRVEVRSGPNAAPRTVGYVNFFNFTAMTGMDTPAMMQMKRADPREKFFSFDVEEPVRASLASGGKAPFSVRVTPVGKADPRARPVIGDIRVVRG